MQDIQPYIDQIISYANLEENWDNHGAEKISQPTIQNALKMLHEIDYLPEVVYPLPTGEIALEFYEGERGIDIDIRGNGECNYVQYKGLEENFIFVREAMDVPFDIVVDTAVHWLCNQ